MTWQRPSFTLILGVCRWTALVDVLCPAIAVYFSHKEVDNNAWFI